MKMAYAPLHAYSRGSSLLRCLVSLLALLALHAPAAQGGAAGQGLFAPAPLVAAAVVPAQFDITGFIQEATLDSGGAICKASDPRLAGGTLRVNNVLVVIPCNTILQMPAATLTWQELFALAPRDMGLALDARGIPVQIGLALKDTVTLPLASVYSNGRLPSYEVHVQGNVVQGRYIAGLVFISQQNLNIGQGTITRIDYHNGELQVASAGPNGEVARIKINDPLGRFGLSHGGPGSGAALVEPTYDPRFSIDEDSPTIHAATGYPMCIPRSDPFADADDPLCPQSNRPRSPDCASLVIPFPPFAMPLDGQYCTSFMMPPPPASACTPTQGMACAPDSTQQAPFEEGDFIDFQGTLKYDSNGPYVSAHTIVNHVGIYTSPGSMPAYIAIEMELMGTAALPVANLPQETTSRVKIEGFTTDPTSLVDIYAIDVDPVTGASSERLLGIASPFGPPVVGRFRFKPAAGAFMPPVREFRVVSRTLCSDPFSPCQMPVAAQTYANGVIAGQYHAPNFEFIFPENLIVGDALVPANFQDFVFLYCGSGLLTTPSAGTTAPRVGQLEPAPWAVPMPDPMFASNLCPGVKRVDGSSRLVSMQAPIANALALPATAAAGQTVTLSAATSTDANTPARPLTYVWTQTAGPAVVLSGTRLASPSFKVPNVTVTTTLTFSVAVTNSILLTSTARVSVVAKPALPLPTVPRTIPIAADTVALLPVTWDNRQLKGKLTVVATSTAIKTATPPKGISMSVTYWSTAIAAGLPGSASNPMVAAASLVKDVAGQAPVCGNALPCFVAALVGVINSPGSSAAAPVFLAPTNVVVKSSLGGTAAVSGAAIAVR